jgi:sulfide dehydrogenase cytochrome subunit
MIKHATLFAALLTAGSTFAQTTSSPPGRLLASNCFQCHGTNGSGGFDRLAGETASEIVNELKEMRTKSSPGIMEVHARGYTDAQLQLIGSYFANVLNNTASTVPSTASEAGATLLPFGSTSKTRSKHD